MNFSFLNQIQPVALPVVESKPKGRVKQDKNPTGLTLRIFKDGSVYPSQELVDEFGLEYFDKTVLESTRNNGFDIYSSIEWCQFPKDVAEKFLFISAVPKSESKVTLFGSVDYNEDGTPKKSVLNQGSKRPELLGLIAEVFFGIHTDEAYTLFDVYNYIDVKVNTKVKVFEGLNEVYVPKRYVKGSKAGQMSYETRINTGIYPISLCNSEEVVVENQVEVLEEVNN